MPRDDLAEHGVLAVEPRLHGVSITYNWLSALVASPACAMATAPLTCVRVFEISAAPIGLPLPPLPQCVLLGHVARLRIAQLHHEVRHDAVHALAVVETPVHQLHDVRHGLRRLVRIGLELERALLGLDDDDRAGAGRAPWRGGRSALAPTPRPRARAISNTLAQEKREHAERDTSFGIRFMSGCVSSSMRSAIRYGSSATAPSS